MDRDTGNSYAAILAKSTLGAALIYQGDVKRGQELLDSQTSTGSPISNRSYASSPLLDFVRLGILAYAYTAAHLTDKAMETWRTLLDRATSIGNQYFIGESARKLGELYINNHDPEKAFKYYETAAKSLRITGNHSALLQVLSAQATIAESDANHSVQLPEIYDELLWLARENKGPPSDGLQFAIYLGQSLFYKGRQEWTKELESLEKAESIKLSIPTDENQKNTLNRTWMQLWVDHAVAADKLSRPEESLLAMEMHFIMHSQ